MFSVIFPGQGSQTLGMGRNLYENHNYIKELFDKADEILGFKISKVIFEGPNDDLNNTENTQPAIFLVSYCIFEAIKRESNFDLLKAKYFAGHSLGEYSALSTSSAINFETTIKLLKIRGKSMQSAVPKGSGGMIAILGSEINYIKKLIESNKSNYECFIANDNSNGQIVISGKNNDLDLFVEDLKKNSIKNVRLPVSAPFHCKLMKQATNIMSDEIEKVRLTKPLVPIVSNVTGKPEEEPVKVKNLLIQQIESPVRWRESVLYMINNGVKRFIEIGPGKVLSGLIKRIDRSVGIVSVNDLSDFKNIDLND